MNFDFKIPDLVMPSEEELQDYANNWWERQAKVSFHGWNDVLKSHSYDYRICPLPSDIIRQTLDMTEKFSEDKLNALILAYDAIIHDALVQLHCESSYFAKLISRSPKDYLADEDNHTKPVPTTSTRDLIDSLISSMRCYEDLVVLLRLPEVSALVIRPFVGFKAEDEWRALVLDGKVMGISQYYYQSHFESLTEDKVRSVEAKIRKFIDEVANPNLQTPTYVADFIIDGEDIKILETNPFGLSDPCLFESYGALDGTIKWNKTENHD